MERCYNVHVLWEGGVKEAQGVGDTIVLKKLIGIGIE